eukprot:Sspe_Gene.80825::Locus_51253_Transcript_1_1_Confidence_1.000_Length_568::g.80825::m.80825
MGRRGRGERQSERDRVEAQHSTVQNSTGTVRDVQDSTVHSAQCNLGANCGLWYSSSGAAANLGMQGSSTECSDSLPFAVQCSTVDMCGGTRGEVGSGAVPEGSQVAPPGLPPGGVPVIPFDVVGGVKIQGVVADKLEFRVVGGL